MKSPYFLLPTILVFVVFFTSCAKQDVAINPTEYFSVEYQEAQWPFSDGTYGYWWEVYPTKVNQKVFLNGKLLTNLCTTGKAPHYNLPGHTGFAQEGDEVSVDVNGDGIMEQEMFLKK